MGKEEKVELEIEEKPVKSESKGIEIIEEMKEKEVEINE